MPFGPKTQTGDYAGQSRERARGEKSSGELPQVTLVSASLGGGAGRATKRIFDALQAGESCDGTPSRYSVVTGDEKSSQESSDFSLFVPPKSQKLAQKLARKVLRRTGQVDRRIYHSFPIFSTGLGAQLNASTSDVINLHWVGENLLSIREIGQLQKPIVWTLHDEWAYRGGEHYGTDNRHIVGYDKSSALRNGLWDVNRVLWASKRHHWRAPITFVAPSQWIADQVRQSAIGAKAQVHVIPNALDTDFWKPLDREGVARRLGLDPRKRFICFGALELDRDWRKGGDLLAEALTTLREAVLTGRELLELELIVFGGSDATVFRRMGWTTHSVGMLDPAALRDVYSVAETCVMPSRLDNVPQVATESISSGTPVAGFDVGGLESIVQGPPMGFLAKAFDPSELARGIAFLIRRHSENGATAEQCHTFAENNWNFKTVSKAYERVFSSVMLSPSGPSATVAPTPEPKP